MNEEYRDERNFVIAVSHRQFIVNEIVPLGCQFFWKVDEELVNFRRIPAQLPEIRHIVSHANEMAHVGSAHAPHLIPSLEIQIN